MVRRLTILGVVFSLVACLRAAAGQTDLEISIAISIAEAEAAAKQVTVNLPNAGEATRPLPVTKTPPAFSPMDLPADAQPTPMESVVEVVAALRLKPSDIYEDIGCGRDCRVGITAAERYGCKVIAIEIDPAAAAEAKRYVEANGLSHLITVIVGDAAEITTKANKASAYLFESDLERLKYKIAKYEKFVTYAHEVPGLDMKPWPFGDVYVYDRPPAMVAKMIRPTSATWNGQEYTRAKSGCNCAMCRSLRSQLAPRMVMVPVATEAPAAKSEQPAGRYVDIKVKHCNGRSCWYETQRVWQAY